ncbi:oxidoreductase [Mycobacterium sp. MS1601]|uniref:flavin reductase family protein n=1 Tax=Mycobacterium sp. MS1601 TaxID=1936029 RepID=UPI0009790EBC|nr:flavin reductase family protein [Mycobacterium sp. MS1601]AQA05484.1 oxidoreductase [Mycobacterium sp. MS1601]
MPNTAFLDLIDCTQDDVNLRETFAHFPSGIAALSAIIDAEPRIVVASSFQVGISAQPPLVMFAVQHTSTSWPKLRLAPRVGVSVLAEKHRGVVHQLSSRTVADRFAGVATTTTASGAHLIDGAAVHFECHLNAEIQAGDHTIVLLQVAGMRHYPDTNPLVWHGSSLRTLAPAE